MRCFDLRRVVLVSLAWALLPMATPAVAEPQPRMEILLSSHFLHYHPDLRYRRNGFMALERGAHAQALLHFRRAAEYSDKPSQAMVAELYWSGSGVAQDRALAYAWMDLAAERGYPTFVAYREQYWNALTDAERGRIADVGTPLYARYGDAVAVPRMEHMLRKGRMHYTGSIVGHVAPRLAVWVSSPSGGMMSIRGDQAYQKRFWAAKEYFAWQDEILDRPLGGIVEVGTVTQDDARDD